MGNIYALVLCIQLQLRLVLLHSASFLTKNLAHIPSGPLGGDVGT